MNRRASNWGQVNTDQPKRVFSVLTYTPPPKASYLKFITGADDRDRQLQISLGARVFRILVVHQGNPLAVHFVILG